MPRPPASGVELLPDPLLGRIFSLAEQSEEDITLVCRRWHRVLYSEPALWRELALTAESLVEAHKAGLAAQWFASKARLLRRVGHFVHALEYSQERVDMQQLAAASGSGWRLGSSVLAHLSPASLEELVLKEAPLDAAAAAELRRLSSLTQLCITNRGDLPSCAVAALPSLPQLRRLELSGASMPQGLPAALRCLAQLTALHCYVGGPLPDLTAIYSLTQLRELGWGERGRPGMVRLDAQQLLARLPHLELWSIGSLNAQSGLGSLQVADATLRRYDVHKCSRQGGTIELVLLDGVLHMASLQQLVAAGLPPGTQPSQLCSLGLFHSVLSTPALLSCPFLGHLTELTISFCTLFEGTAAALEVLLQQAPRLQGLSLLACLQQQPFPPALVSRTGLQHLCLKSNDLADLPPGPYLNSLESLDLHSNSFRRLPAALSAATGLTELSLAGNFHLALTHADVEGTLLRLPRLSRLYLGVTQTPVPVLWRMFTAAPQLQVTESPGAAQWGLAE